MAKEAKEKKHFSRTQIMTPKDAAKYLSLHLITVYRLVKKGKLPGFKVGGQWRLHLEGTAQDRTLVTNKRAPQEQYDEDRAHRERYFSVHGRPGISNARGSDGQYARRRQTRQRGQGCHHHPGLSAPIDHRHQ